MAPNAKEGYMETDIQEPDGLEKLVAPQAAPWDYELYPLAVILMVVVHLSGLYGISLITSADWKTLAFIYTYFVCGMLGLTAGAHRLWSHRSFKATRPLEIFLMLCHSSVMQFSVIWWVQVHRQHHKYSDTDGDPMNSSRGFFFSHIGWLLTSSHPATVLRRKYVDVSDVRSNPILVFQKKYSYVMIPMMTFFLPSLVPLLWGESFNISWNLNMLRVALSLNLVFIINSIGHIWGNRPYDKNIRSTQTTVIGNLAFGDGYHNFHHVFPWDYRSSEWGTRFNFTTMVIDLFAKIGLASELKSVEKDLALKRARRTGDGSGTVSQAQG